MMRPATIEEIATRALVDYAMISLLSGRVGQDLYGKDAPDKTEIEIAYLKILQRLQQGYDLTPPCGLYACPHHSKEAWDDMHKQIQPK